MSFSTIRKNVSWEMNPIFQLSIELEGRSLPFLLFCYFSICVAVWFLFFDFVECSRNDCGTCCNSEDLAFELY